MVEVRRLETGPCRLFLKLEYQNPGGSIKDRVALAMIEAAEREGRLASGGLLVEATAATPAWDSRSSPRKKATGSSSWCPTR